MTCVLSRCTAWFRRCGVEGSGKLTRRALENDLAEFASRDSANGRLVCRPLQPSKKRRCVCVCDCRVCGRKCAGPARACASQASERAPKGPAIPILKRRCVFNTSL